jgi:Tol biopolymer transport system component
LFAEIFQKYADQPSQASAARAQVASGQAGALTMQRIDVDPTDTRRVSPDGRFMVLADVNLALHELATGQVREITADGSANDPDHRRYPLDAIFSADGRQVAYDLYSEKDDRSILRTASIDNKASSRTLVDNAEIDTITPTDWSSDGRFISVVVHRRDRTAQIGLVAAATGGFQVLRTVEWIGPTHMAFSPDSRALAYDRPSIEGGTERDVYVMDLGTLRETAISANPGDDRLVGWNAAGRRLLFTSDRSGTVALWSAAVDAGFKAGAVDYLNDLGVGRPIGLTRTDALYYKALVSGADIWAAPFDRQKGQLSAAPVRFIKQFKGLNQMPEWSADGQYLAYVSKRDARNPSPVTIVISSSETGEVVREVQPRASYLLYPKWSPDGRTFVARGADLKGRSGILRIDALSGETTIVAENATCSGVPYWAAQGRSVFCHDFQARQIVEMDVDSGAVRRRLPGNQGAASPDGRYLAFFDRGGLRLLPLAGGAARELLPSEGTSLANLLTLTFTPDSRAVVFRGTVRGTAGVWMVDIDGGEPRRVNIDPETVTMLRFNPKTWQIAYAPSNGPRYEIRRIEHYLSAVGSRTAQGR